MYWFLDQECRAKNKVPAESDEVLQMGCVCVCMFDRERTQASRFTLYGSSCSKTFALPHVLIPVVKSLIELIE